MAASKPPHVLMIEARFYADLADELVRGAVAALDEAGATYERIEVPGALDIPTALAMACDAGLIPHGASRRRFQGCLALGCVIRGETSHYDIVAGESTRWLMQIATSHHVPLGNGILTVENSGQAWERARGGSAGKGGDAARACLRLIEITTMFYER